MSEDKSRTIALANLVADAAMEAARHDYDLGVDAKEIHVESFKRHYDMKMCFHQDSGCSPKKGEPNDSA